MSLAARHLVDAKNSIDVFGLVCAFAQLMID